tara:strand:- start:3414 stop:3674 length:261 start_codon:yes stop_codon:yes gene_type:complete
LCLIFKPGGIQDKYDGGYLPIVVRDATTGSENTDMIEDLRITNAFIDQIEMLWGYSETSAKFLDSLESGGNLMFACQYLRLNKPME